jgi:hypothetical protein
MPAIQDTYRRPLMRTLAACAAALCLVASPALAASPKIDAAVKTFKAVAGDAGKLKTFCAMSKVMESAGEKEDPKIDAQIQGFIKQLGPDFETAWAAGEDVDENSADGKVYNAALDDLSGKCS